MNNTCHKEKVLGVSLPVFSLKSEEAKEWGDFLSLKPFGEWAATCGFRIIQILPVNDTGPDPSPYMLRSSLALNPIYIRISEVLKSYPECHVKLAQYTALISEQKTSDLTYKTVRKIKLEFLASVYDACYIQIENILTDWIAKNEWVQAYAVFCFLQEKNHYQSWTSWPEKSTDIHSLWQTHQKQCIFYAWVQFHLDKQLCEVSSFLREQGISLKGDMPIMVAKESVDTWCYPHYFDLEHIVGAAPDEFNKNGQIWNFPAYHWAAQEKDSYTWWKQRLWNMERFFHMIRLDHVAGFFRLWLVPLGINDARCGYFYPASPITKQELIDAGFLQDEILAISTAPLSKSELSNKADHKLLIGAAPDLFYPSFDYPKSHDYQNLNEAKKQALESLISQKNKEKNLIEYEQGSKFLQTISCATSMTLCAEDLGVLPQSLPELLDEHQILHLCVARWMYHRIDKNILMELEDYPSNSVATTATHDSSMLAELWENEPETVAKFLKVLALPLDMAGKDYTSQVAMTVLHTFIKKVSSPIVILPIQEYLALSDQYRTEKGSQVRINIPGTTGDGNWHYRIKPDLDDLCKDVRFIFLIRVTNTIF